MRFHPNSLEAAADSHLPASLSTQTVTVYTRHSESCSRNDEPYWKRCHCMKYLYVYRDNTSRTSRASLLRTVASSSRSRAFTGLQESIQTFHFFQKQRNSIRDQLLRWSGLRAGDAACLSRDKLLDDDSLFLYQKKVKGKASSAVYGLLPHDVAEELRNVQPDAYTHPSSLLSKLGFERRG